MSGVLLDSILSELSDACSDIEASAIISADGFMVESRLPRSINQDRVSAMSAAIVSLGNRATEELVRGECEQILIKGKEGYLLMMDTGKLAALIVMIKSGSNLVSIFPAVKRAVARIAQAI